MKNFLFFVLLISTLQAFSQNDSLEYVRLKREINTGLKLCDAYSDRNDQKVLDMDIDSIVNQTAHLLTKLLKLEQSRNLRLEEFPGLSLSASTNDQTRIRIYAFSYNCGGTMGILFHNVMQWTNRQGKLFAWYLPWNEYGYFNSTIYTLRTDSTTSLYLLTGAAKESSTRVGFWSVVFKFSGDFFYTNYHAFGNRNQLWLTNVYMTFDSTSKVLHLSGDFDKLKEDMDWSLNYDDHDTNSPFINDTAGNRRFYNLIMGKYNADPDYPTDHGINLQWNGTRFVNVGPAEKADEY